MTKTLLEGFNRFRKAHYESDNAAMPRLVADGQKPEYFMISCIDSRSNPGTIFCSAPGTFFAHKAMGAIVRPYKKGTALAAALQFALFHNQVHTIILLGHTNCGAIKALIDKIEDDEIASFIDVAQAGLGRARRICDASVDELCLHRAAEEQIVLQSAENLQTYPSVVSALAEGRVIVKPWLFDMERGRLLEYDAAVACFKMLPDCERHNADVLHQGRRS